MQFNIHRLLHVCFYKLIIFIIILFINYFHKIKFKVIKNISYVSCKHACLAHKMIVLCGKNNDKYPCELLLICAIGFFHKIHLRLINLEI
jgi:hypothetical protein